METVQQSNEWAHKYKTKNFKELSLNAETETEQCLEFYGTQ